MEPDGEMDAEERNLDNDRDSAIDLLIRRANELPRPEVERPSDEAVDAYLLGAATEDQKQEVLSALAGSSEFRKEILSAAMELDELSSPEVREKVMKVKTTEIPDLIAVIFPEGTGKKRIAPAQGKRDALRQYLTVRRLVPVFGAIAVLLLVLLWNRSQEEPKPPMVAKFEMVSASVPKEMLIALGTRDATTASAATSFADADSAALAELRHLVYLSPRDYELHVVEKVKATQVLVSGAQVLLRLARPDGSLIQEFMAIIPDSAAVGSLPARAWALGLPARSLYSYPITSDTVVVTWSDEMGTEGAVTFTYTDKDGHHAVTGFVFKTL